MGPKYVVFALKKCEDLEKLSSSTYLLTLENKINIKGKTRSKSRTGNFLH